MEGDENDVVGDEVVSEDTVIDENWKYNDFNKNWEKVIIIPNGYKVDKVTDTHRNKLIITIVLSDSE